MTASDPQPASSATRPVNVNETVAYRVDAMLYEHIPLALFLCLLGLVVLAFPAGNKFEHQLAAWIPIFVGIGWIGYALYRRRRPGKAMITLTPSYLLFRIPMVKEIRIPWREIAAVEVIDTSPFFPSLVRPRFVTFRNVTALRVSRRFYDRQIHVPSAFMRGPGWSNTFIVGEKDVRVALHHEAVGVPAEELREAVEARWHAFGPPDAVAAATETAPASSPPPRRPQQALTTAAHEGVTWRGAWRVTKIAALLVGIAAMLTNIAGVWQTASQEQDRKETEEWQAQFHKWEEEDRRTAEEKRKHDAEWDEFWRKNRF